MRRKTCNGISLLLFYVPFQRVMRTILTISAAVAVLFAQTTLAFNNVDVKPISYQEEAGEQQQEQPETSGDLELTDSFSNFRWSGNDVLAQETFTVNLDQAARIQVTDYKNRGDTFQVYDNGELLGETSEVEDAQDAEVFAATPEEALEDERFSKGTFDLEEGEHKITIKATGPYEAGTAAIRLVAKDQSQDLHKKKGGWDDDKDDKKWDDDDDDDKEWGKKDKWDDDDDDDKDWGKKKDKWDDDDDDDDKDWGKKKDKWEDDDDEDDKEWGKKKWEDDDDGKDWGKKDKWDDDKKGGWGDKEEDPWGGKKKSWGGSWDDKKEDPWGKKESWGGSWEEKKKDPWPVKKEPKVWDKWPKSIRVDPSHTITFTKTEWIIERPSKYK